MSTTYRFSTFQELVDRVPADRICDCLDELGKVLAVAKETVQLTYAVACDLAKADGKEIPPEPAQIMVLPSELEWIDDGKRDLGARIMADEAGPFLEINITSGK